jgi:hypothetical protein
MPTASGGSCMWENEVGRSPLLPGVVNLTTPDADDAAILLRDIGAATTQPTTSSAAGR